VTDLQPAMNVGLLIEAYSPSKIKINKILLKQSEIINQFEAVKMTLPAYYCPTLDLLKDLSYRPSMILSG
jgi:hypothetical protein